MNRPILFLDRDNKTKLVPAFFLAFYNFYVKKIRLTINGKVL